jgi:protein-disulfide reductase (glutathione)
MTTLLDCPPLFRFQARVLTLLLTTAGLLATVGCREAQKPQPAPVLSDVPSSSHQKEDARWNNAIAWVPMLDGLEAAKKSGKPALLVFYTEWCPHCRTYAKLFHDPQVVEASEAFVMIRVNEDATPDLGVAFRPDGQYVPRTFLLSPDGKTHADLVGAHPKYKHFLDEDSPDQLLALMKKARSKFAK